MHHCTHMPLELNSLQKVRLLSSCWPVVAYCPRVRTRLHFRAGDSDNNGLWTSLVVGAEYFRYGATKSQEAGESAAHFLAGMQRLHDVTGVSGLYARSICGPDDNSSPRRVCAASRATQYTGPCGFNASSTWITTYGSPLRSIPFARSTLP